MNVTGFGASLMSRFESGSEAMCHSRDRSGKKSARRTVRYLSKSTISGIVHNDSKRVSEEKVYKNCSSDVL